VEQEAAVAEALAQSVETALLQQGQQVQAEMVSQYLLLDPQLLMAEAVEVELAILQRVAVVQVVQVEAVTVQPRQYREQREQQTPVAVEVVDFSPLHKQAVMAVVVL
jgi:hypothetical protein